MVKEIQASEFKEDVLDENVPVLLDFNASWCAPCRMMAPILDQIETQMVNRVKILKINTDKNQDIAMKYQITGIPCLVLFKGGQEVDRFVGLQRAEVLVSKIEAHI